MKNDERRATLSGLDSSSAKILKTHIHSDAQHKTEMGKLDYIDALRGIAALSIVIYHVYGIAGSAYPLYIIPDRFIGLALTGIPLFFIISAFTLYLSLDKKEKEKKKFLKFYLRRFFRIAPLFYFLLLFVLLDGFIMHNGGFSWSEVLANFTFTFNLLPKFSESLFSDGWTVGVEMLFYSVLPLIYIVVNNIRRSVLLFVGIYWISGEARQLLSIIIGESIMTSTNYNYYNFFHWAYIFPIGIVCYLIYKSYLPRMRSEYKSRVAFGMLLLSLIILFIFVNNMTLATAFYDLYKPLVGLTSWLPMSSIAFVLMVLSLSLASNRVIVNRFTRFFGTISYSLYLIHPFIVDQLKSAYAFIYGHAIWSTDLALFLCIVLTLLIAIPVSLLTYHFIESPGIRLGKKVMAKL